MLHFFQFPNNRQAFIVQQRQEDSAGGGGGGWERLERRPGNNGPTLGHLSVIHTLQADRILWITIQKQILSFETVNESYLTLYWIIYIALTYVDESDSIFLHRFQSEGKIATGLIVVQLLILPTSTDDLYPRLNKVKFKVKVRYFQNQTICV